MRSTEGRHPRDVKDRRGTPSAALVRPGLRSPRVRAARVGETKRGGVHASTTYRGACRAGPVRQVAPFASGPPSTQVAHTTEHPADRLRAGCLLRPSAPATEPRVGRAGQRGAGAPTPHTSAPPGAGPPGGAVQAPELEAPVNITIAHLLSMTDEERQGMEDEVRRQNEQSARDAAVKRG